MSDDDMRTPARKRFDEVLDGIVAEAMENEKDRCLSVVVEAKMDAAQKARYAVASSLRECEHVIRTAGSESQPPAEEPMTIARVMDWLNSTGCGELELSEVERQLTALVREQVLRDADECVALAVGVDRQNEDDPIMADHCMTCHDAILKAAGLG